MFARNFQSLAAWRVAAAERIEKYRKGGLIVVVKDKTGQPVANAEIEVKMRRHAYGFGTCVSVPALMGRRLSTNDLERYKESITNLFNKAVLENDLKWPSWARTNSRPQTTASLDWLRKAGIPVRGHNLIWPSWENTPKNLRDLKDEPAALNKAIIAHIEEETAAIRGCVVEWDVINEPFSHRDILDILGKSAMVDWFKAARRGDPQAKLYINDFDILAGEDPEHRDDYFTNVQYLVESGAPIDGIGFQSHIRQHPVPPEEVYRRLDRFAGFKKDLQITEFDIDITDEPLQADYERDFLTVVFSHPSTVSFMMWGFWQGSHWLPNSALIRKDWTTKPVVKPTRRTKDGAAVETENAFSREVWKWEEFGDAVADLRAASPTTCRETFLMLYSNPGDVDWFDDAGWKEVVNHWRLLARLAKQGGMRGLLYDAEPYVKPYSQFRYSAQPGREHHTFADYRAKAYDLDFRWEVC